MIIPPVVFHQGEHRLVKLATGDVDLFFQQGNNLKPQLEFFKGKDFNAMVGNTDGLLPTVQKESKKAAFSR